MSGFKVIAKAISAFKPAHNAKKPVKGHATKHTVAEQKGPALRNRPVAGSRGRTNSRPSVTRSTSDHSLAATRAERKVANEAAAVLVDIKRLSESPEFAEIVALTNLLCEAAEEFPTNAQEAQDILDQLQEGLEELGKLVDTARTAVALGDKLACEHLCQVQSKFEVVRARIDQIGQQIAAFREDDDMVSEKSLFNMKDIWTRAARHVLLGEIAKLEGVEGREGDIEKLQNAVNSLEARSENLRTGGSPEPLSDKQLKDRIGNPITGVRAALDPAGVALRAARAKKAGEKMLRSFDFSGEVDVLPTWHPKMRDEEMLGAFVTEALSQANVGDVDVMDELNSSRLHVLNNDQSWDEIVGKMTIDGREVTSTTTPQNLLFDDPNLKGKGVNSYEIRGTRITNAAATKLEVDGKTVFKAIRHGVLSAYGLHPKALRKMSDAKLEALVKELMPLSRQTPAEIVAGMRSSKSRFVQVSALLRGYAARERSLDLARTALAADPAKLEKALKGETVELDINSVGLLTPSRLMNGGNEIQMVDDQIRALRSLGGEKGPITLQFKDAQGNVRKAEVRIKTRAFNFGVNMLALEGGKALGLKGSRGRAANLMNGWRRVEKYNDAAMAGLMGTPEERKDGRFSGDVGAYLARDDIPEAQKNKVRLVAKQIAEIYDSGSYRSAGKDPYKLVARLALLFSLMEGKTACYNCKSGKDRTGAMDTMAKYLAHHLEVYGDLPEPDSDMTEEQQARMYQFALKCGSPELQKLSTGVKGFQLNVKALAWMVGGAAKLKRLLGLSPAVKS